MLGFKLLTIGVGNPLKGLTGFYLRPKGKAERVVVSIELLHRSLEVEIEDWTLEKVSG